MALEHSPYFMQITLLYSDQPRHVQELTLQLAEGTTVVQALHASSWPVIEGLTSGDLTVGVWGKKATADQVLHDQDRLEIYRALRVDPKVARRERFAKQGARGTGLFAKRRPGGKAGY
jgi:putative ubiquitin-RnfH superfamily antitoxin RatB of RatAB toxin-antitoxin module